MFFFPSSNLKSPITFDNDMFHCCIQLLLDKLKKMKKKKQTSSRNHESCSRKHRTLILLYMWNYLAISEIPVKKKPIFTWITVSFKHALKNRWYNQRFKYEMQPSQEKTRLRRTLLSFLSYLFFFFPFLLFLISNQAWNFFFLN